MYLMYVDESGDIGLNNSPTPYFVLCGLVVHELRWKQYLEELVAFRKELKKTFGVKLREEVHASHLINSPGRLARIEKYKRLEILRRAAEKYGSMSEFSLISVVVDKRGKPPGFDVFANAWQRLIQRFENTLSYHNFPGPKNPEDKGMLFPDRTDNKKLNQLLRKMRAYNPVPNKVNSGYRDLLVKYIVEDANFRDSADSLFVQAVDVIAFLLYQSLRPSSYMKQKAGHKYFERLHPICCKHASNTDPLGIVRI